MKSVNSYDRPLYDPFGAILSASGPLADANLYRFSSKEFHPESGLYYYGYRFYQPDLQRWVSRDPIYEEGGVNLYRFVENSPLDLLDSLGLETPATWWEDLNDKSVPDTGRDLWNNFWGKQAPAQYDGFAGCPWGGSGYTGGFGGGISLAEGASESGGDNGLGKFLGRIGEGAGKAFAAAARPAINKVLDNDRAVVVAAGALLASGLIEHAAATKGGISTPRINVGHHFSFKVGINFADDDPRSDDIYKKHVAGECGYRF
jgi:RHS repeat-associated protein